jgi:hypothetical protein
MTVIDSYHAAEIHRAAGRSLAERDGGKRFARVAERALDPELVRAIELASGVAIAEHLTEVFRAWSGDPSALDAALVERARRNGIALVIEKAEADDAEPEDDGWEDIGEHPYAGELRSRGTMMIIAAVVLAACASLLLVLAAAIVWAPIPLVAVGCTALSSAPLFALGSWFAIAGRARRKRADRLRDLEGLAFSHARLPLDLVARELETTPAQARALVREALGSGILAGRLDLEDGGFLSAIADERFGRRSMRCASCGASSAVVRGRGLVPACPYCSNPMRR